MRISLNLKQIFAVCLGHFMNDIFMNLLIPLSFLFKAKMGLTFAEQAMIGTVIISLGSFAQPIVGYLVDKKGRSGLLIVSILWIGIFTSITGFINNYYLLLVFAGIGAIASALYHPLGSTIVIQLLGKTKGAGLSIFITVGSFAVGFAPFVAIPIATNYGLKYLIVFLIPAVLTAVLMFIFKIHKIPLNQEKTETTEAKKISKEKMGWVSSLITVSVIRSLVFRSFLLAFGFQLLISKDVNEILAGLAISVMMWTSAGGTLFGGYLDDRYGGKKIMHLSNFGVTTLLIALIFANGILEVVVYCLLGFVSGIGNTPNITMVQEIIPQNTSLATGLVFGLGGGLAGVLMFFYGQIADATGLLTAVALLLIPVLIMDTLIFFNPVYEKGEFVK